jgi:hypothetical protein
LVAENSFLSLIFWFISDSSLVFSDFFCNNDKISHRSSSIDGSCMFSQVCCISDSKISSILQVSDIVCSVDSKFFISQV